MPRLRVIGTYLHVDILENKYGHRFYRSQKNQQWTIELRSLTSILACRVETLRTKAVRKDLSHTVETVTARGVKPVRVIGRKELKLLLRSLLSPRSKVSNETRSSAAILAGYLAQPRSSLISFSEACVLACKAKNSSTKQKCDRHAWTQQDARLKARIRNYLSSQQKAS